LIEQRTESKHAEHHFHVKVSDSDIDLSGASRAKVKINGRLNPDLSGASSPKYAGNVVPGKTSTSGASKIRQTS